MIDLRSDTCSRPTDPRQPLTCIDKYGQKPPAPKQHD
jgi:hypothetical protein